VIEGAKGATLNGLDLADGKLRWQVRLDEAVAKLCAADDATAIQVVRVDKKAHLLSLSDGALRPAAATTTCAPLRCDRPFDRSAHDLDHRERKRWGAALSGMKVEEALRVGATTLALGHKTPGTSVPMIAAVQPRAAPVAAPKARSGDFTGGHGEAGGPKVLWQTVVPASNPLSVKGGAPDPNDVALDGKAVAVAYEMNDHSTYRLTVFSLADGRRRYDIALPKEQRGLWSVLITPQVVIVTSTWGVIAAFDVESGRKAFTID